MTRFNSLILASAAAVSFLPLSAQAAPAVVVSIKPLHSLVAAIMKGAGEPALIVDGAASPHTFSLKPSNAAALQDADVVFWVGHGLEAFMEKPLAALSGNAKVVEMDETPGIEKLAFRAGGAFDAHDHGDEESTHDDHAAHSGEEDDHDHDHGGFDMHLWLDPMNAKAMARQIETTLVAADPENAALYHNNATDLQASLDALDAEVAAMLAPVADKPFVVFHDGYQYFEHRYHLTVAGSVTVSPEILPGAERLVEIQAKVRALRAVCVFAEPQFQSKLINVVIEGSDTRSGILDPLGAELTDGPDLYPQLIRNMATSVRGCLSVG
ncbi:MAG: zinc ABC transporter substrate-binding protein ZnuA [Allorhizobium sp.]